MGCTPSSRRSRTETELKYSCPNETANEDTNNQTEPLNCSQKGSESKPFLPMTYYDNNKDLSNCKDLSNKNKDNTLKLGSMCLSMPQLKFSSVSSPSKKRTITLPVNQSFFRQKYIKNQQSLFGSLFQTMTNEKLIIVIVRVKKDDNQEKSVPLSFKFKESDIPEGINTSKIQAQNLVEISLDFAERIPALVIALADDSNDLMKDYKRFCEISKSTKMPPIEAKTIHLINIEGIKIKSMKSAALISIQNEKFKLFMKRIEELKAMQKNKSYNTRQSKPAKNKKIEHDSSKSKAKSKKPIIELSSEDESTQASFSKSKESRSSKERQVKPKSIAQKNDSSPTQDSSLVQRDRIVMKLKVLANHVEPMEESLERKSFEQIIKILYIFSKNLVPESHIKEDDSIRIIPEKDSTRIDGDFTFIEGLLPVHTRLYKKAIHPKTGEKEPTVLLANIVRYAFPPHWIRNVTIRGSGTRKSLISLWNYENPHNKTVEGCSIPGLGDKRFRALIDHVVRKCGKKSYDAGTQKNLVSTFAKALHYSRTRIAGESAKKEAESSATDSNADYSSADEDFNGSKVKLICAPDIYESDEENDATDDSGEESLVNSLFDAPTINADESSHESDGEKNKSTDNTKRPATTTIEKIKEDQIMKPVNDSFASPKPREVARHKNLPKNESSDKKNHSSKNSPKVQTIKNVYYSSPAGGSKRPTNDSSQSSQSKKPRKSYESENLPQDKHEKVRSQNLMPGILSQDESKIHKLSLLNGCNAEADETGGILDNLFPDDQDVEVEEGEVFDEESS